MKKQILSLFLAFSASVTAINGGVAREPAPQPNGKAVAPKTLYTCPMHPQIRWSKADNCPICGMKLAAAKTAASTPDGQAANHEHMYMGDDSMGKSDHDAMQMNGDGMRSMGGCGMCMEMMGMGGMKQNGASATQKAMPRYGNGRTGARGGRGCGC